jgi:hypothetical protein
MDPNLPSDYVTARLRFRDAADRCEWKRLSCPIGAVGPTGEDLTIDIAISPTPQADRVLVVSSGLHGVEAPLGSAIQVAMMEKAPRANRPQAVRTVLLHALNPYGFAWSRRCDADNIDVNRNFFSSGSTRQAAEAYSRFDRLLNTPRPPSRWDLFYPKAAVAALVHGLPSLREALATGQSDFPKGLFFAGTRSSRTKEILEEHMKSWIGQATLVAHLDFHTGLGRWGTYQLLIDHRLTPAQGDRLGRWFGSELVQQDDDQRRTYRARGTLGQWCVSQRLAESYVFAFAECGTYGNLSVVAGLRAENQAHHWGRPDDRETIRAKDRLRELFYPASSVWQSRAFTGGLAIVDRAISGLAAEAVDRGEG